MRNKNEKRLIKAIKMQDKLIARVRDSVEKNPFSNNKKYEQNERKLKKAMNTIRWCLNFSYKKWFYNKKVAKMLYTDMG